MPFDLLLGIETSCDETAAAVVEGGRRIRSSVVASQVDLHERYGGVVPELASRKHMERIFPVVDEALDRAGVPLEALDGIAVTRGPGLVGALAVGIAAAKALAYARGVPLVGVHHVEGHLYANVIEHRDVAFPALGLVVSGAHTDLIELSGDGRYRYLGRTRDDAAGEAFDKVARAMGLGYPGGPAIDRLAAAGDPRRVPLPRPMAEGLDFSFSGLKTAVLRVLRKTGDRSEPFLADLAAAFQGAVVSVLVDKFERAAREARPRTLLLGGGVAANSALRRDAAAMADRLGLPLRRPSPTLCTDNAAMIAAAGWAHLVRGERSPLTLSAAANLDLPQAG